MTQKRVLIIEDDLDMIGLLKIILKRGGYEPISALGGKEGLRLLQEASVDLILLDLMMDDINGWEVLERIKADPALRMVPVIIVSARHQAEDPGQTETHSDQFEGYVVKPFVVRDLLTQIQEVIP